MRHAPPVSVLCRGHGWRGLQASVFALVAAAFTAWCVQHAEGSAAVAAAGAVVAAWVAGGVAWAALRHPAVALCWDGERWSADGQAVSVQLMLDAAGGLLLRFRGPQGQRPVWLGISSLEADAAWHGLRTALYASPRRPKHGLQEVPVPQAAANSPATRGGGWR